MYSKFVLANHFCSGSVMQGSTQLNTRGLQCKVSYTVTRRSKIQRTMNLYGMNACTYVCTYINNFKCMYIYVHMNEFSVVYALTKYIHT